MRGFSTRYFNVVTHLPIAAMRDQRIFACRKIDNRLRCRALPRNLTVFAPNGKLRAGRLGLDFERTLAPHEMKRRRMDRALRGKIKKWQMDETRNNSPTEVI